MWLKSNQLNVFKIIALLCLLVFPLSAVAGEDDLFHSPSEQEQVLVVKVTQADALVLEDGRRMKLLGVESFGQPKRKYPKLDEKGIPIEEKVEPTIPLEEQAVVFAQNLMEGKRVKLEYDVESRDEKGNKVVYVYLPDGRMANVELLREGFVRLKIRPPNIKYGDLLKKAYQEARKEQRGFLSY